jgi:hypothetical protein
MDAPVSWAIGMPEYRSRAISVPFVLYSPSTLRFERLRQMNPLSFNRDRHRSSSGSASLTMEG